MNESWRSRIERTILLLVLAVACTLAACAGDGGDGDVDTDTDTDVDSDTDADTDSAPIVYGTCPEVEHGTPETLVEKAAHFDRLVRELHVHPRHELMVAVRIADGVPEATATYTDVARWYTGENDGLWSGAYLTSQAFRHAVTRGTPEADEALENLSKVLAGTERQMRITGVPGLYTREYRTPGIAGLTCPEDPASYRRDPEKDDNRWLEIRDDGCVWLTDEAGETWIASDHCGYAADLHGYCWLDNVSKDEYSGHLLALGAISRLVDDPDVRGRAAALAAQVADHLMQHDLTFVDWDGRVTEHGRLYPLAGDDFPGFNAMLALSWFKVAAALTGRDDIADFYSRCLLQRNGPDECQPSTMGVLKSYLDWLDAAGLYVTEDGCINNWNNFNMFFMAAFNLMWLETDPEVLGVVREFMEHEWIRRDGYQRQMVEQKNTFFNFVYAATKDLGPGGSGPGYAEVEDGICTLRQLRASKAPFDADAESPYAHDCESRLGGSMTAEVIPIYLRCPGAFYWTRNPYQRHTCRADPQHLNTPGDYLLAYWMGRYFGFIPADL